MSVRRQGSDDVDLRMRAARWGEASSKFADPKPSTRKTHQAMMVGSSLYMRPLMVLTLLMIFCTEFLYSCIGSGFEKKSSCTCAVFIVRRLR